jgi:hypothetical protein
MMRKAFGCLLLAGMTVAMLPSALRADSEVANPAALFPIVKDARGVRVHGPVAIYYDIVDIVPECGTFQVNMFFVLRLRKGDGAPAGFAGQLRGVCYEAAEVQIPAVLQFIQDNAIPFFFPNAPGLIFALRDVTRIVQDGQAQITGGVCDASGICSPYFFLMNIDLRVRPR